MEQSIDLLSQLKEEFALQEIDIRTYSPLTLAYIGDAIYDLVIRTVLVERGNRGVNKLHKSASKLVKAVTQAAMAEKLWEDFTEEEQTMYKRGRNAKSYTSAKNASVEEYRKATGLEALMGFLYLTGDMPRIIKLIRLGMEKLELTL